MTINDHAIPVSIGQPQDQKITAMEFRSSGVASSWYRRAQFIGLPEHELPAGQKNSRIWASLTYRNANSTSCVIFFCLTSSTKGG